MSINDKPIIDAAKKLALSTYTGRSFSKIEDPQEYDKLISYFSDRESEILKTTLK